MRIGVTVLLALAAARAIMLVGEEWAIATSERRLEQQTYAIQRGDGAATLAMKQPDLESPPRALVHEALMLARGAEQAPTRAAAARARDAAASAIAEALWQRPRWGEAWTVSAFISSARHGPRAAKTAIDLARSYDEAPYLRYAAPWRISASLVAWDLLPLRAQSDVVNEAVWLAHLDRRFRDEIFTLMRGSPAYAPFLLAWRDVRWLDEDLAAHLRRSPEKADQE